MEKVIIGKSTLIHADCASVLSEIEKQDALITDPPYGINLNTSYRHRGRGRLAKCKDYEEIKGDDKPFDPSHLFGVADKYVIWGANYFPQYLKPQSGWLVWDKRVLEITNDQADCELAYTNCVKGVRIFRHMWNGFLRDSERGEGYHATQKPVALMSWIISLINPKSVIDPYMGSGPVGLACQKLDIPYIGIEINKKYFDTACERIEIANRQMRLF